MPSGNVVMPDKMQFPAAGGSVHGGAHRQWLPDERDGFIAWLRAEFAAANAIIDVLCHHLCAIGDLGEYDAVIGYIQQRRCNWNPVLHMQQYFPVGEVGYALEQVAWRRQQQQQHRFYDNVKGNVGKEAKRGTFGCRQGQRVESVVKEGHGYGPAGGNHQHGENDSANNLSFEKVSEKGEPARTRSEVGKLEDKGLTQAEEKKDLDTQTLTDGLLRSSSNSEETISRSPGDQAVEVDGGCASNSKGPCIQENDSHSIQIQCKNQNLTTAPKTFVGTEMFDGKMVNVVEGLKLYEQLFDDSDVAKLVSLVNDLRCAGKRGQLQGHTFVVSKRPMKGHGREMIQLGVPIVDTPPEEENTVGTSKDRKLEGFPSLLGDVIERLTAKQAMTVNPDSCIIDIYNEGDHSQPYMWPQWFGRPVSILFLTECDMTFGKAIGGDHPGDYRGSLQLSLAPGSLLSVQGKSADFARHAIPSIRKQRILVTFTKSQPRKTTNDGQRLPSHVVVPSSHWNAPPSRSLNHIRHPVGPKHYAPIPASVVLSAAPLHPQLPPPNGIQPLFVAPPVAPTMSFPSPVPLPPGSTTWPAPPRHPPPRIPVPGTGVFLPPPGSGNSSASQLVSSTSPTDTSCSEEMGQVMDKENGTMKSNQASNVPTKEKLDAGAQKGLCNGRVDTKVVRTEEHQLSVEMKEASKPSGAV